MNMNKIFNGTSRFTLVDETVTSDLEKGFTSEVANALVDSQRVLGQTTSFADVEASDEAKAEVFNSEDARLTGEFEGRSVARAAMYIAIASGSSHMYSVHHANGVKAGKGMFAPLSNNPTTEELKKFQENFDNVMTLDYRVQAALDDPKKANGKSKELSSLMKGKHKNFRTDDAKHAGKVRSTRLIDGKKVFLYYAPVNSPEVKFNTATVRTKSNALSEKIYEYVVENTQESLYFDFDDEFYKLDNGKPVYVLKEGEENSDLTVDVKKFTVPCQLKVPAVSAMDVEVWNNELPAELRTDLRASEKEYSTFDLVELVSKVYTRAKYSTEYSRMSQRELVVLALTKVKELVESVNMVTVDDAEFENLMTNTAAYSAFSKAVTEVEGHAGHFEFDNGRMTKVRTYMEMFFENWKYNKDVSEGAYADAEAARKAWERSLLDMVNRKTGKNNGNFTVSIENNEDDYDESLIEE